MRATFINRRLQDLIQIFIVVKNAVLFELGEMLDIESLAGVIAT
jgi:hypothetical protein